MATVDDIKALGAKLSNWGRWGADDEIGALNFITPEKRVAAASLVRRGAVFSLALPLDQSGPAPGVSGRTNPLRLMMQTGADATPLFDLGGGAGYTDDMVVMPLQSSTQWDSLAHVFYDGTLYNGVPAATVDGHGAPRDGIDKVHDRFVSRGVLLDIPRVKGLDELEPGYAVTADDLEEAERHHGVRVTSGDILLVRTGFMVHHALTGQWNIFGRGAHPGLHYETTTWLHEREVAAIAADNFMVEAADVVPGVGLPMHMIALRDMGLHLGELWHLDELAADCASDGVYEFMLVAPALRFTGGVGSPLNPLAIK